MFTPSLRRSLSSSGLTRGSSVSLPLIIELLFICALIAIVAAMRYVQITQSALQQAQENNGLRQAHLDELLTLLHQYEGRNHKYPQGISTESASLISKDEADICAALVSTYSSELPYDPITGYYHDCASYNTGYSIMQTAKDKITITAPQAELGKQITLTR